MHGTVKVEREPSNPAEAIGRMKRHVEAYRDGGLDRENEDIALGERFGLDLEKIKAWWSKARKDRAEKERWEGFTEVHLEDLPKPSEPEEEEEEAPDIGPVEAVIDAALVEPKEEPVIRRRENEPIIRRRESEASKLEEEKADLVSIVAEMKPSEETVEEPEVEPKGEPDEGVEDQENPANDIRRKLWRVESALEWINPEEIPVERVGAVLWWMSSGDKAAGCQVLVNWAGEEVRSRWQSGEFKDARGSADEIWELAQRAGWRFPIAQNLNKLHEMTMRAEAALVRGSAEIYHFGGRLVRSVSVEVDAAKGRKTRVARLLPIEPPYLKGELSRFIDFFAWSKDDKARRPIGPPNDVIHEMLGRFGQWEFPAVSGVLCCPTLRRDGSVLAVPGFDPATGLLVIGPLPDMPDVAKRPSEADARRGIGLLDGLLDEFPFVDAPSRSAALSGMISPVVRGALTCVPMHASSAPAAGTGKSYLFDVDAGIANGDLMHIMARGESTEEMEKRLGSHMLQGIGLLSIDNVTAPLGGDALCQAIERPTLSLRILGQSKMPERRNNWCLYATGHNLRLKDDVTRRTLLTRLDRGMERPELYKFKSKPFETVLANRGLYLWAALTVVRAYQVAGMPGRLPWIGDPFGEWSDLVRSALVWLGYADPVETMEAVRDLDPSRQARTAMWAAMANAYGGEPKLANEMIKDAKAGTIHRKKPILDRRVKDEAAAVTLHSAIIGYTSGMLDARHFGNKLNTDKNAIAGGLCLRSDYDTHNKVNRWFVEPLSEGKA